MLGNFSLCVCVCVFARVSAHAHVRIIRHITSLSYLFLVFLLHCDLIVTYLCQARMDGIAEPENAQSYPRFEVLVDRSMLNYLTSENQKRLVVLRSALKVRIFLKVCMFNPYI